MMAHARAARWQSAKRELRREQTHSQHGFTPPVVVRSFERQLHSGHERAASRRRSSRCSPDVREILSAVTVLSDVVGGRDIGPVEHVPDFEYKLNDLK